MCSIVIGVAERTIRHRAFFAVLIIPFFSSFLRHFCKPPSPYLHRSSQLNIKANTNHHRRAIIIEAMAAQQIPGAGLCRNWSASGSCHFGINCRFAHLSPEGTPLHAPPNNSSTPCRNFMTTGECRFGKSCHYSHDGAPQGAPQGSAPVRSAPAPQEGPPQEYETYLDKNTGHHRLKGGAMLIRDPTEEEKAAAAAER